MAHPTGDFHFSDEGPNSTASELENIASAQQQQRLPSAPGDMRQQQQQQQPGGGGDASLPGSMEASPPISRQPPPAAAAAAAATSVPKLPPLRNYSVHPMEMATNAPPAASASAAAANPAQRSINSNSNGNGVIGGGATSIDRRAIPPPPLGATTTSFPPGGTATSEGPGAGQGGDRINDLLQMLECPICMDTADSAPIYQCPEGHLLCEECNSRVVDCPQCGHALMNSRNRTAEELAERLQVLRGDRRDELAPTQTMVIAVSAPRKVRRGLFSHVVYHLDTRLESGSGGTGARFSVSRRYSEVLDLHSRLVHDHRAEGVIVPPPPAKSRLATVAVMASRAEDLNESVASRVFERKCVALDRYMKRLARHPVLRKDPNFRAFLEEKEAPKSIRVKRPITEIIRRRMNVFRTRFTVSEQDPWFQTRLAQLDSFARQLSEMRASLRSMGALKRRLRAATSDFQRGLVSMLVGRSTTREGGSLGAVIGEVVDCHRTMAAIHQEQSVADDLIVELAEDYRLLIEAARETLSERKKLQQDMQTAQKAKKNPLEEVEKAQEKFDKLSQAVRRELEHFDYVMRSEFGEAFEAYKSTYWQSLKRTNRTEEFDLE